MRPRSLLTSLSAFAALGLFAAAVGATQPQEAGQCPNEAPWSRELPLDYPPSIAPGADGAIDTTFVVRKRNLCVATWTPKLCTGTYTVCNADTDCGTGSCDNAQTCLDSGKSCTAASQCAPGACSNSGNSCTKDSDCDKGNTCGNFPVPCTNTWGWQVQNLRSYGSPKAGQEIDPSNADDPNIRWGYPGPTLRAVTRKLKNPDLPPAADNLQEQAGTRIKLALYNYLEPTTYKDAMVCNPATYRRCSNDKTIMCPFNACPSGGKCEKPRDVPQHHPECFHGDNVTNLHYHGTHVSPQPPQDYVLLNLFPYGSTGVPTDKENYALGKYQTDINPLPWNQAPGTHWYHPHKHGSTSLQVLNGLSGSLIISGAFDDWLNEKMYKDRPLVDRVLVIQQVTDELNFFNRELPNYPPQALVNGFATPKIKMRPGEIQRWRFIGATMQASAALEIGLDPRIKEAFQIAQDGVQFAWQNYARQPYRDTEGTYSNFKLFPGNRADFLIKAPLAKGSYSVDSRVVAAGLANAVNEIFKPDIAVELRVPPMQAMEAAMAAGRPPLDKSGNPLLFTIEVGGEPVTPAAKFPATPPLPQAVAKGPPVDRGCAAADKPDYCWPDTPSFLADLPAPKDAGNPRKIDFSIDGNNQVQPNSFWINNTQYDASCAGASMVLSSAEDWLVANKLGRDGNKRLMPHPFHIHINPFQVLRDGDRKFEPPYIWQDTIALPTRLVTDRQVDGTRNYEDAKTKCPQACAADKAKWNGQWTIRDNGVSVCGCVQTEATVLLRHRFDDFTGGYVIHCHFLGHEDRGMMWNVQTVSNNPVTPWTFCTPQADGGPDVCPGARRSKALPECKGGEGTEGY